ncbi:MAG TPA: DUF433 domain-containing protein [Longimicrobium sp.]|nr:DUF433 domain-containing protein [Longimicrobium sp.]
MTLSIPTDTLDLIRRMASIRDMSPEALLRFYVGQGLRRDAAKEHLAGTLSRVIGVDPEIMGGTPVFSGTRVPVKHLFDYLQGGHALDEFLDDFPTVTREQGIAALHAACEALISD